MSGLERYFIESAVPDAPKHTGLVPDIMNSPPPPAFLFHQERRGEQPFSTTATSRIHTSTALNQTYFSNENLDLIQNEIRYHVWEKSNRKHTIDRQTDDDLKIIMRSYYLQYATFDPKNVQGDIQQLNSRVVQFCVNRILGEINMYMKYRKDISDFPEPIAKPVNANIKGTKSAEFKSFF